MSKYKDELKSHYDNLEAWLRVEREAQEIQNRHSAYRQPKRNDKPNLEILEKQVLKKQRLLSKKDDKRSQMTPTYPLGLEDFVTQKFQEAQNPHRLQESQEDYSQSVSQKQLSEKSKMAIESIRSKYQSFKTEVSYMEELNSLSLFEVVQEDF